MLEDNVKLYAIKQDFKGIRVFEVDVIKETKKSFRIEDSRLYRSIVNYSDLYIMNFGIMFGTDKELLVETWNKEIDLKVSKHEKEIDRLRNMFIK